MGEWNMIDFLRFISIEIDKNNFSFFCGDSADA